MQHVEYTVITELRDADSTILDHDHWHLVRLEYEEHLGAPYLAVVVLETEDVDLHLDNLALADFSLTMARPDGLERHLYGVVTRAEFAGGEDDHIFVRLTLSPTIALLDRSKRNRIFQDLTVLEVATKVTEDLFVEFGREPVDTSLLDASAYERIDYCAQYGESDLRFLERIVLESGLSMAWDHDGERERLVLVDANTTCPPVGVSFLDTQADRSPVIVRATHTPHPDLLDEETVFAFDRARTAETESVERSTWDWKLSTPDSLHAIALSDGEPGKIGTEVLHGEDRTLEEDDGEPGDGPHRNETTRRGAHRLEELGTRSVVSRGRSNLVGLQAGSTFELVDHDFLAFDAEYLATKVTHFCEQPVKRQTDSAAGVNYRNTFECIPLTQAYRRERLPRPSVKGLETATVVGPTNEEIYVDRYGRIKVRMHWDVRPDVADEDRSCWVRVAQMFAGPGWGSTFTPRVGQEVLIQYVRGNPDRPICVGTVTNELNTPSYEMPTNRTRSTIKTQSSPGGGGYNELTFEDAAGAEQVIIHAQKDLNEVVKNNHSTRVGSNHSNSVGANQTITVGHNQSSTIGADQTITVKKCQTETVHEDVKILIEGKREETVVKEEVLIFEDTRTVTVTGAEAQTYKAGQTVTVKGSATETVEQDKKVTVEKGSVLVEAKTKATFQQTASHKLVLEDGATLSTSGDYTITNGKTSVQSSKGELSVIADKTIILKCGAASIELNKTGEVKINGAKLVELSTPGTKVSAAPKGLECSSPSIKSTAAGEYVIASASCKIN